MPLFHTYNYPLKITIIYCLYLCKYLSSSLVYIFSVIVAKKVDGCAYSTEYAIYSGKGINDTIHIVLKIRINPIFYYHHFFIHFYNFSPIAHNKLFASGKYSVETRPEYYLCHQVVPLLSF
jgi:hypothetical protein